MPTTKPVRRKTATRSDPPAHHADVAARPAEPVSAQPPAVLRAFDALRPNDIYLMAPKESVTRGFDYYQRHRLQGYAWSPDRSRLTAFVQGTRLYTVTFFVQDDALFGECDCPAWSPEWPCKHVLCVCFTTKNLLSPETFRLHRIEPLHHDTLRVALLGERRSEERSKTRAIAPAARVELVIDATSDPPALVIRLDGYKVTASSGWLPRTGLPREVTPLLTPYYGYQAGWGEDPFLLYLKRHADTYPLLLETRTKTIPLRWQPSVKGLSKTVLDVAGDQVHVRAACVVDDVELAEFLRFRTFVVDVNGGRLLHLTDEQGWAPFLAFQHGTGFAEPYVSAAGILGGVPRAVTWPDQSGLRVWQSRSRQMTVTMPLQEFRSVQLDVLKKQAERVFGSLILKIDGKEQPPPAFPKPDTTDQPIGRLLLLPPADQHELSARYRLRAESLWQDRYVAPSASVFGFFPLLEQGRHPAPLRAWKRKTVMMTAYLDLVAVTDAKEQERRLRRQLGHPVFHSREVRREAQWALQPGLASARRSDLRLEFHDGHWVLRSIDKVKEAALYRIPCEVFGPEIFRGMRRGDEMAVPAPLLFQRLADLVERSAAAGIPVLYDKKPVRAGQWDCSVRVERWNREGTGIDWFEIRPEIRCDGAVLEEKLWREAVRRGGLIETGGKLLVLDASTLERLRALASLADHAKPARSATRLVTVPRLALFEWLALREQGVRVSLPAEDEAVLARLLRFERIEPPPLPAGLQATLRSYQRDGYGWLAFLYQHRFGGCLADDMGLGKTLQAICLLGAIKEGIVQPPAAARGPHLIVVPTSLLFNWEQELARFYPDLTVRTYTGTERVLDAKDDAVVLTTYGLLRRDIETLARTAFHVIIFDEAQAVKNLHADTTAAARRLTGSFKLAMTGTPLENHLGEYFSIIDLSLPGLLGDYERFKAAVKGPVSNGLERLLRRTRPFVLRRTKEQTLPDLPDKIETDLFLDLTDRQKALYQQTVAQVRTTIDDAYRSKTPAQAQLIALTAILKLRQVCLSPRLLTGRPDEPAPKLELLLDRLKVLLEEGHCALVFSQFTGFLDLVEEAFEQEGIPYSRLDGSTAPGKRKALVTAFQARKEPGAFLLSLKAGGQGLNLTKATYVFHLDPWWNPAVEQQASDRAHRIGQKRAVTIMRLLMRQTVEEKMMALKRRKLDLYQAVVGATVRGGGGALLTKADFDFLLAPAGAPDPRQVYGSLGDERSPTSRCSRSPKMADSWV
ncbi:MAG: DEAD/DEAH box helicase [Nitrospirota bacterium]